MTTVQDYGTLPSTPPLGSKTCISEPEPISAFPTHPQSNVVSCHETLVTNDEVANEDTYLLASPAVGDTRTDVTLKSVLQEAWRVMKISLPLIAGYAIQQSINAAPVISLGHLGATELAAAALSSMFAGVTGYSIIFGLATALDTLCAQAITASEDQHAAGIWLQRGLCILSLCLIPVGIIWLHTEDMLLLVRQEPELAALSGAYMRNLLPGLLPIVIFECLKKFLQSQGIYHASTMILLVVSPINALLNYLFVWCSPLGFIGAPIATAISQWLLALFAILYVRFVSGKQAWGGFSKKAFAEWGSFLRLGIPGMVMICAEWWAWEIVALFASYLGTKELAAQSVALTVCSWIYMMPLGVAVGATNRVGNMLGARMANRAHITAIGSMTVAFMLAVLNSSVLTFSQSTLGRIFNDDEEVLAIVCKMLPIVGLFQMFDCLVGVGNGILRGVGKQTLGAIVSLTGYYVVAIPSGLFFAFGRFQLRLPGIWWGLALGLVFNCIVVCTVVYRIDWNAEVKKCIRRAGDTFPSDTETCEVQEET